MRSAALTAPGRVEMVEIPAPAPGPSQVRIRVEGCGICGSNLPPWQGRPWFKYPFAPGAPGHEAWGVVESLGRDAAGLGLAEGDRVACLGGAGFAELEVVDAASVLPLPRALDGQPCPAEPLACAVNAFQRCDVQAGHRVAVVGVGFLGALLVQLASRAGARVVAVARRRTALDMARRMGAAEAVTFSSAPAAAEAALAANGGAPFDRVVEAVGVQESLDLSSQLVRERGRLIIAGYHQDGSRTVDMQSWNWRGLDVINAHERDPAVYLDGMRRAVEAIAAGALDPAPLYTHRFRLDQLAQAFQAAADRPEGFMKALVIP